MQVKAFSANDAENAQALTRELHPRVERNKRILVCVPVRSTRNNQKTKGGMRKMQKTWLSLTDRQFSDIIRVYRKPEQTRDKAIKEIVGEMNKGGLHIPRV